MMTPIPFLRGSSSSHLVGDFQSLGGAQSAAGTSLFRQQLFIYMNYGDILNTFMEGFHYLLVCTLVYISCTVLFGSVFRLLNVYVSVSVCVTSLSVYVLLICCKRELK